MNRNCTSCKKNKLQIEYDCPYINNEPELFYDFRYYNEPEYGVKGCPVYYKNENTSFFSLYNYIENGLVKKHNLTYIRRIIYNTFKEFIDVKQTYKNKHDKKVKR